MELLSFLLHPGADAHGHVNIWVLVALGVVANVLYYGTSGPGLLVKRAIGREAARAIRGTATLDGVELPLREGRLQVEWIEFASSAPPDPRGGLRVRVEGLSTPLSARGTLGREVSLTEIHCEKVDLQIDAVGGIDPSLQGAATPPPRDQREGGAGVPERGSGRSYRVGTLKVDVLRVEVILDGGEESRRFSSTLEGLEILPESWGGAEGVSVGELIRRALGGLVREALESPPDSWPPEAREVLNQVVGSASRAGPGRGPA